jgi:hypothetical protein
MEDCDEEEYQKTEETIDAIHKYHEYLRKAAQCAFVQQRANALQNEMRYKFRKHDSDPIQVFFISSSMYLDWMKHNQPKKPHLNPRMTGIPALRKYLLTLPAQQNWEHYRKHVEVTLPDLLDQITRIAEHENKNDGYGAIRPQFKQLITQLEKDQNSVFRHFIESNVPRLWDSKDLRSERLAGEGTRWNT